MQDPKKINVEAAARRIAARRAADPEREARRQAQLSRMACGVKRSPHIETTKPTHST